MPASRLDRASSDIAQELYSEGYGLDLVLILTLLTTVLPLLLKICVPNPSASQIRDAANNAWSEKRQRYRGGAVHRAERIALKEAKAKGIVLSQEQATKMVYKAFDKARGATDRVLAGCCAEAALED